jgi:hypothetical protein
MPDEVNGQMMQILLSDYVADTASFVFQKSGKIHAFLKEKVLSSAQLPYLAHLLALIVAL